MRFSWWFGVILAVALHGTWALAQAGAPSAERSPLPAKITIVDDRSYAPFAFVDSHGEPRGISADIWKLWSTKTGVKVDLKLTEWDAALAAVKDGQADAVGGIFHTPQRESVFDFTRPYFIIETSIFIHEQIRGIRCLEDLDGFRVGVVRGDSAEEMLRDKSPNAKLEPFAGAEDLVRAAASGAIKTFVLDSYVARFYLAKHGSETEFREVVPPASVSRHCAAVKKGNESTLALLQQGLDAISKNEMAAIVDRWTGRPVWTRIPWPELGATLATILAVICLLLLWNLQLKRRVAAATRDLTLRNEELQRSERNYREIFDATSDVIFLHDAEDGTILDLNQAAVDLCGRKREELTGRSIADLMDDEPPFTGEEALRRLRQAATDRVQVFEWRAHRPDGTVFWTEVALRRSSIGGENRVLAVARDIGERKQAQEEGETLRAQLMQAQKMESIGRLAGGVAHDFNNMLSVILGSAELALRKVDPTSPLAADLRHIEKAARRSADLTGQLLAFARKQTVAPRILDINDTVGHMVRLLQRLIGEDIELTCQFGANLPAIKMDPAQIDQILANLCVNARDAASRKICIITESAIFDQAYCEKHLGAVPGHYVLLAVTDDGAGMDTETQQRVFEPFFTTKEIGQGTGLGLATVYGIVKQNNGFVDVYSEVGNGATFRVYLPQFAGVAPEPNAEPEPETLQGGGETVLLVEDEPAILGVGETMLKTLGYRVLTADCPRNALRLAAEHGDDIHLLVTDVVMPEMDGQQLAQRLLATHPRIRHLFVSGHTADIIAHQGILDEGVHFLQKPFSLRSLALKVRETLDSR